MFRIAALLWIILATTLAGIALLVVVTVPSLAGDAQRLIPIGCAIAAAAAIPLSYILAWRISLARTA